MKTLKLFFISFLLLITINFVSALTLNTFWQENNQDEINIVNGESATIVMEIGDIETTTSLYIDIALDGNGIYNNVVDPIGGVFETIYTVIPEDYSNQIGQYQVSVQVYDADNGELKTDYLELNVIQAENTAPYFDDLPNLYLNKNSGFNNNLLNLDDYAHDNENDPLTFTILQESNINVVDCSINNNYLDCNVIDDMIGESIITVEVSDGELSDTGSFTVYVQEGIENIPPTINIIQPVENEHILGVYDILWVATDPDQASNTLDIKIEYQLYEEILSDEWIVLEDLQDNNDGIFEWDTTNVNNDKYILRITVTDDENAFSDDDVIFYINNQISENTAPSVEIIKPEEIETISGIYNIEWDATDLDQSANTLDIKIEYKKDNWWYGFLSILGLDNNWIILEDGINNNDGVYSWNTLVVENDHYKLRITVTDDGNLSDEDEVLFEIDNEIAINHDPIITSEPVTVAYVNQLYSYDVNAIDIDGDILTYWFDSEVPSGMLMNPNTGLITWTPTQIGNYPVEVKVIDNNGGEDTQEFTINVLSEEPPVPPVVVGLKRHKFLLSNIITKEKENYLDVYVNLYNKGSYKENMELKAVIIQTGDVVYDTFNLDVHDGYWRFLRFNKPLNGNYVIRIEAESDHYKDMRYITVKI